MGELFFARSCGGIVLALLVAAASDGACEERVRGAAGWVEGWDGGDGAEDGLVLGDEFREDEEVGDCCGEEGVEEDARGGLEAVDEGAFVVGVLGVVLFSGHVFLCPVWRCIWGFWRLGTVVIFAGWTWMPTPNGLSRSHVRRYPGRFRDGRLVDRRHDQLRSGDGGDRGSGGLGSMSMGLRVSGRLGVLCLVGRSTRGRGTGELT